MIMSCVERRRPTLAGVSSEGISDGGWVGQSDAAVSAGVGLVELPDQRMGITICGSPEPHKHLRQPPHGHIAWAWWPKRRLTALEARAFQNLSAGDTTAPGPPQL